VTLEDRINKLMTNHPDLFPTEAKVWAYIPNNIKDRRGYKRGRLTVVGFLGFRQYPKYRTTLWECLCECGNFTEVTAKNLLNDSTKSCGCWNKERVSQHARTKLKSVNTKHGMSHHPLYDAWNAMMSRCYNPSDKDWDNYGGRGILVCDRWKDITNYIADLLERPYGYTLDRIDVDREYSPENCRWANSREQGLNTRFNRDIPNIYPDGNKWKVSFQWNGQVYYAGMYDSVDEAKQALEDKLLEVGYHE